MEKNPNTKAAADAISRLLTDQLPIAVTYLFPPNALPLAETGAPSGPAKPPLSTATGDMLPARNMPSHSPDFTSVRWPDPNEPEGFKHYTFTPKQRAIVSILWEAKENGTHFVGTVALLEAAAIESCKLFDVFRGHDAWKRLIVPGPYCGGPAGTYRLAPIDFEAKGGAA